MITIRKSNDRGHANHGWLDSRHTFSFAEYYDPQQMQFRTLRVINEDLIAGGGGFPMHPHRDMEIITYVVSGAVAHRDTTGGAGVIRPGMLQHMSAGTGVRHSEVNASATEPLHLLQIWLLPERAGLTPRYGDVTLATLPKQGALTLAASPDGRDGTLHVSQDVLLYIGKLSAGATAELPLRTGRAAWVQLISGVLEVNGHTLSAGDAAAVTDESLAKFSAKEDAHFLVFDLA